MLLRTAPTGEQARYVMSVSVAATAAPMHGKERDTGRWDGIDHRSILNRRGSEPPHGRNKRRLATPPWGFSSMQARTSSRQWQPALWAIDVHCKRMAKHGHASDTAESNAGIRLRCQSCLPTIYRAVVDELQVSGTVRPDRRNKSHSQSRGRHQPEKSDQWICPLHCIEKRLLQRTMRMSAHSYMC
jgi:hypothetical protein